MKRKTETLWCDGGGGLGIGKERPLINVFLIRSVGMWGPGLGLSLLERRLLVLGGAAS